MLYRLLGVGLLPSDCFSINEHIQQVIKTCSQRLYLLCQSKLQGMNRECLNIDDIVTQKLYASSAWSGFVSLE